MMGIALELRHRNGLENISFLLINQTENNDLQSTKNLQAIVNNLPKPLEIWAVNFNSAIELNYCNFDTKEYPYIDGYGYKKYSCN